MYEEFEVLKLEIEEKMNGVLDSMQVEYNLIRTGRANPALLDRISIEYYGVQSPINQLASINIVEGTQLYIKPFDKSLLKQIEDAVNKSDLGLPTSNDGVGIRIVLPALTGDRRKEISKQVDTISQTFKVQIRNIRREYNAQTEKLNLREDDEKTALEEIQKLTDEFNKKIDELAQKKSKEIQTL